MMIWPEVDARRARALPFVIAWIVILLTAGVSAWSAFLGLGIWAPVVQFGMAAIQTASDSGFAVPLTYVSVSVLLDRPGFVVRGRERQRIVFC